MLGLMRRAIHPFITKIIIKTSIEQSYTVTQIIFIARLRLYGIHTQWSSITNTNLMVLFDNYFSIPAIARLSISTLVIMNVFLYEHILQKPTVCVCVCFFFFVFFLNSFIFLLFRSIMQSIHQFSYDSQAQVSSPTIYSIFFFFTWCCCVVYVTYHGSIFSKVVSIAKALVWLYERLRDI